MTEEQQHSDTDQDGVFEAYASQHLPIPPHYYPLWIKGFAVILIVFLIYSFFSVPKYFTAAKKIKAAQKQYSAQEYQDAYNNMADVLNDGYYTKKTRILMAKILFKADDKELKEKGLSLVYGLELKQREYDELMQLIPPGLLADETAADDKEEE